MPDWIEELRRKRDIASQELERDREWQMRSERIIANKAPAIWHSFCDRVREDASRLAATFPADDAMKLRFEDQQDGGFSLTKDTYPAVDLSARFQASSNTIELRRVTRDTPDDSARPEHSWIDLKLNSQDQVMFVFQGVESVAIEHISERLIRSIIGI